MLWKREPALIIGAVLAVIQMAVGFGLNISSEQQALVMSAIAGVLSAVTRSQVSPVNAPPVDVDV